MIRYATARSVLRGPLAAAFALGLSLAPAAPSAAATLSVVGGTSMTLPAGCDRVSYNPVNFCAPDAATATYIGLDPDGVMRPGDTVTRISAAAKNANPSYGLHLDGPARVSFTFLGKEASWTNVLAVTSAGWDPIFNTGADAVGTASGQFILGSGLAFTLKTLGLAPSFAIDGGAVGDVGLAFSAIFNNGRSVIVGYDNSGAGPDFDYDDLVARIDVAPIPLPAAVWLLAAGLGGLGFVARRRRAT